MEKSSDEKMRIVLKNFDAVRNQKNALESKCKALEEENNRLKTELAQQKALYKNMLDRFTGNNSENLEVKYKALNESFNRLNNERSRIIKENKTMKRAIDSARGMICDIHNRMDDLCESAGIEYYISDVPNQAKQDDDASNKKESQNQKFIKYVRTMIDIYKTTGALTGISKVANGLKVSKITKIQFFKYGFHEDDLTDEKILKAYEEIKKK